MTYLKKFICAVICCSSLQLALAQNNYTTHILKQGETLSMLATQYNTSVGDIMRMNGMHADSKLVYGSKIKIPPAQKNALKTKPPANTIPVSAPPATSGEITHIVTKGETLYSISKKYNISVDQIKTWNNLATNDAKTGTLLIVNERGINKMAKTTPAKQKTSAVAAPVNKEPVVESRPDNTPASTTYVTDNIQPAMQAVSTMSNPVTDNNVTAYTGEGYFGSQFLEKKSRKMQTISGISKTFKTASGWGDGKYYILANDIEPGTIVKITADNGSAVYAKVLWNLGEMKENAGINFRVSNATAAALHLTDPSFNLNVSF